MVPCEAFLHMDTINCNLSKIGSKIIAKSHIESIYYIETGRR